MWTCVVIFTMVILVGLGLVPWGTGLEIIMRMSEVLLKFKGLFFFLDTMGGQRGGVYRYVQHLSTDI